MASRTASSLLFLVAILFVVHGARAAPSPADRTLAQSLFEEGRRLMDTGHYAEACPKLADSQRLDPGGGTLLNLALCHDKLGRVATAYAEYQDALAQATADKRRDREDFARERIAGLTARLPRLEIDVAQGAPPDAAVELDGSSVPASAWGTPMLVDPGAHTVHATAADRATFHVTVMLAESETRAVRVDLGQPTQQAPEPQPTATGGTGAGATAAASASSPPASTFVTGTTTPEREVPQTELRRPVSFWVIGGLGVVALAVRRVTGVLAMNARSEVQSKCNTSRGYCSDPSGVDAANQERTMAWTSTGTIIGGALAVVLAFALPMEEHVTTPAGAKSALASLRFAAAPAAGGGVVVLGGTWR